MPVAAMRSSTSPVPGTGSGRSSTTRSDGPRKTSARTGNLLSDDAAGVAVEHLRVVERHDVVGDPARALVAGERLVHALVDAEDAVVLDVLVMEEGVRGHHGA